MNSRVQYARGAYRAPRTISCPKCYATTPIGEYTAQGWSGQAAADAHAATCSGLPTSYACGCPVPAGTPPFFARQAPRTNCKEHQS